MPLELSSQSRISITEPEEHERAKESLPPPVLAIHEQREKRAGPGHGGRNFDGLFRFEDSEAIPLLKKVLEENGFTEAGVCDAMGEARGRLELKRIDFPLYERRLAAPRSVNTLIKLFMMQLWSDEKQVAAALAPLNIERLIALGLLEEGRQGIHSKAALALAGGLIIAHDRVEKENTEPEADYVLGVNPSAFTLANLTVRRPVRRALDIGAGSGIQALLAARHSEQVVAVDTNPRALNYLEFNACLNGFENIDCRAGSLFAPVEGCRFDLIACNPPYVISPERQFIFRDSGLPGDQICEQVVRRAPQYLNEEGVACILCNWAQRKSDHWSKPLRPWVENSGCDALLLHGGTEEPLRYAAGWTRTADPEKYGAALDRWQKYYQESGIEALSMGAVILRRRSARQNWVRTEGLPGKPADGCSDHILRIFQAEDFLHEHSQPEALLEQAFVLADENRLSQEYACQRGALTTESCRLELKRGLRFQGNLNRHSLHLISRCDGQHKLREIIAELSQMTNTPVESFQTEAIEIIKHLIAYGFLIPGVTSQASAPNPLDGGKSGLTPN